MRKLLCFGLVIIVLGAVVVAGSHAESGNVSGNANSLRGDYVEARTASVFAGACHYNGELTTTGRDALMAWKVSSGSWNGVDLSGVRALAVVSARANLSERGARRSELIINDEATYAQAVAMVAALKSTHSQSLGEVVAVKKAPLTFLREGNAYSIASAGLAALEVEAMPDDLCCKMPHLVWYEPLVSLGHRKVGYTKKATYSGDAIGEPWERAGENSAFYGTFSFQSF